MMVAINPCFLSQPKPNCLHPNKVQSFMRLNPSFAVSKMSSPIHSRSLHAIPPQLAHLAPYVEHVKSCNRNGEERFQFIPFIVDNLTVGFVHPRFLQNLMSFPKVFAVSGAVPDANSDNVELPTDRFVTLHHDLKSLNERTEAVNQALKILSLKGVIPGWRNELYPVVKAFGTSPLFSLERAAVPYFGTKAYGVHVNGYVTDSNGGKYLWVARRSMTKQTYPGMLDHLVAGGQPEGLGCKENVIKECDEEANIPKAIAERALAVGAVSYEDIDEDRLKRDVLFCYDLELSPDFQPHNKDGEVDSFNLLPISEVEKILQTSRMYKPNCALVVIDFLCRHGYITADQRGYLDLLQSLRKGDCS